MAADQKPKNPTKAYYPRSSYLGEVQAYWFFGKPWFSYWNVPAMLRDPWIGQLCDLWQFPFHQVKHQVKAKSVEVQAWVQKTLQKFWSRYLPIALDSYVAYGFAPVGFEYIVKRSPLSGRHLWELDCVTKIAPLDARPHTFTGTTKFAGYEVPGVGVIRHPYAFWFSGLNKLRQFYDRPPLAGAYDPWLEANGRGGAKDLRQLYMRKHSVRPAIGEHPTGEATFTNAAGDSYQADNASIMQAALEYYEAGSNITLAQEWDEKGNPKWKITPAEAAADAPSVRLYPQDLKRDMAEGIGIPFEVLQAAEGGTGYSGREIPYLAWLGKADQLSGIVVEEFDKTVRPVVELNFGRGADFEITPMSLVEAAKKDSAAQGGGNANGTGGGEPIGGADARTADAQRASSAYGFGLPHQSRGAQSSYSMSGVDPDVMERVRKRARRQKVTA